MDTLPNVPGLSEMAPSFLRAFFDTARSVAVDVDHLAAVVSHESRFRPDAENPESHAVGLIQWLPSTAELFGTTTDALKSMTATEQLVYVAKFFAHWRGTLAPRDVAIAVFKPSLVGKADDVVAFEAGSDGYKKNAALDRDRDGKITVGEVRDDVEAILVPAMSTPRIAVPLGSIPAASKDGWGLLGVVLLSVGFTALFAKVTR